MYLLYLRVTLLLHLCCFVTFISTLDQTAVKPGLSLEQRQVTSRATASRRFPNSFHWPLQRLWSFWKKTYWMLVPALLFGLINYICSIIEKHLPDLSSNMQHTIPSVVKRIFSDFLTQIALAALASPLICLTCLAFYSYVTVRKERKKAMAQADRNEKRLRSLQKKKNNQNCKTITLKGSTRQCIA